MTLVQLRDKLQEQLTQLPDDQLTIVNEFLTALNQQSTPTHSTGKTLLAHLQTIGTWAGKRQVGVGADRVEVKVNLGHCFGCNRSEERRVGKEC